MQLTTARDIYFAGRGACVVPGTGTIADNASAVVEYMRLQAGDMLTFGSGNGAEEQMDAYIAQIIDFPRKLQAIEIELAKLRQLLKEALAGGVVNTAGSDVTAVSTLELARKIKYLELALTDFRPTIH